MRWHGDDPLALARPPQMKKASETFQRTGWVYINARVFGPCSRFNSGVLFSRLAVLGYDYPLSPGTSIPENRTTEPLRRSLHQARNVQSSQATTHKAEQNAEGRCAADARGAERRR